MTMNDSNVMTNSAVMSGAPESGDTTDDLMSWVVRLAGRMDLKTLERHYILRTLESVNGSRKMAVARLGISERTLRHKLRQYRTEAQAAA
jgi:DNA-binding NtrC family response regulator